MALPQHQQQTPPQQQPKAAWHIDNSRPHLFAVLYGSRAAKLPHQRGPLLWLVPMTLLLAVVGIMGASYLMLRLVLPSGDIFQASVHAQQRADYSRWENVPALPPPNPQMLEAINADLEPTETANLQALPTVEVAVVGVGLVPSTPVQAGMLQATPTPSAQPLPPQASTTITTTLTYPGPAEPEPTATLAEPTVTASPTPSPAVVAAVATPAAAANTAPARQPAPQTETGTETTSTSDNAPDTVQPTAEPTEPAEPAATATRWPTKTPYPTSTPVPEQPTSTPLPASNSPTPVPSSTPLPTRTPRNTATTEPTSTATSTPSPTNTRQPTETRTPTLTPSPTRTHTPVPAIVATNTRTPTPVQAIVATNTRTPTPVPAIVATNTRTPTPVQAIVATNTPVPPPPPTATQAPPPPTPTFTPVPVPAVLALAPSSLSFGNVENGASSDSQSVTLTNSGGSALDITSITVSGYFSTSNSCPDSLAPGESCTIAITYNPTSEGAHNGTLKVQGNTSTSPETVALIGTGMCNNGVWSLEDSGPGSLRQEVAEAGDGDTITFCKNGLIKLTSGEIAIDKSLTIQGPSGGLVTISGNDNSRIFNLISAASTLTINDLTLQDGNSNQGGAIASSGALLLNSSTIQDSSASISGGALYTYAGNITLNDSTLQGNRAGDKGGGLYTYEGTVTLRQSSLNSNTASNQGGGLYSAISPNVTIEQSSIKNNEATSVSGGGIHNERGTLTIQQTTLHENSAGNDGGGLFNGSSATLHNSTISSNSATDGGGGIYQSSGTMTLENSTISGNTAGNEGGGIFISGEIWITMSTIVQNSSSGNDGGLSVGSGTVNMKQSILALNTAAGLSPDCDSSGATYKSLGHNLLGNNKDCSFPADPTDQVGTSDSPIDPNLGALQDNGSTTHTHAPQVPSPVIDVIPMNECALTSDQRGQARPQTPGGLCDAGAVEDSTGGPDGPELRIISPTSLNFGTVNVGDTSSEKTITVKNTGGVPLSIISINISGDFAQTDEDCDSLAAGATCTIQVTFKPTQNGPSNGAVEITSNSPTTPDTVSLNGVGDCEDKVWSLADDGPGTLRQLVKDANDGDTIGFCTSGTITLTSDDIEIKDDITIDGTGAAVTISGNTSNRIFKVNGGNDVTIKNITLQDGHESDGGAIYASWGTLNLDHVTLRQNEATSNGGAIYTQGTLNLDHVTLRQNEATSNGGAIYTVDDDITIRESTISENTAANEGGGIYTKQGDLTIDKSTIRENTTVNEGGGIYAEQGDVIVQNGSTINDNIAGSQGGGIYKYNGPLTVSNSTIHGNIATNDYGGGIYNKGGSTTIDKSTISENEAAVNGGGIHTYSGALTVQDSTISENEVGVEGGGIYKYEGVGGTGITVQNSTISGNKATTRGGGIFNYQGEVTIQQSTIFDNDADTGVGIFSFAGFINLEQTIVADNTTDDDCDSGSATYTSQGYNLDSDGTCGLGGTGDLPGGNAELGALQDNGGPTHTHALQSSSDALNRIPGGDCATAEDQRGEPRPGPTNSQCDIGAVEMP